MNDVLNLVRSLTRPRLLTEAARYGVNNYRREVHLRRLLKLAVLPSPAQAAMRLICLEQSYETARRAGAAEYSVARHLDVLIALKGEARSLIAEAQEKASATSDLRLAM